MKETEWPYTVGEKKNADGSIDSSQVAFFRPSEKTSKNETEQKFSPSSEQQESAGVSDINEPKMSVLESNEIQAERIRLSNLEKRYEIDKQIAPDAEDMIKRYETEIKITKRRIDGKAPEGETADEKEEYKQHMNAMSEDEIASVRKRISEMKQL
jgi:hypothetical protein